MDEGPIILVDDDRDDEQLFCDGLLAINVTNPVIHFIDCISAFDYLKKTPRQPFIIFCDVNLPKQNGIEFKRQIDNDPLLRSKSIPFVFFSTHADKTAVNTAYKEMTVQGYFKKPDRFEELKATLQVVIQYWRLSHHPNK